MNSHGVEISIARCVEGMVRAQIPCLLFLLFLFLYHVFIVYRYKKLRAALAMERTKPINQSKQQKKPIPLSSTVTENILRPKPFTCYSRRKQNIRKT